MSQNIRKKDFRCKAHVGIFKTNHLDIPKNPDSVDWSKYFKNGSQPNFLDIGCGYGRYLFQAGQVCQSKNILGLEVREKVYEYVKKMIDSKDSWNNIGVMNTNALLFLVNIIKPKSIEKMFILFPDPHFK